MRCPARPHYPRSDDLHIKLTPETYAGSLQCPLSTAAILPDCPGRLAHPGCTGGRLALIAVFRQGPARCRTSTVPIGPGAWSAWPERVPQAAARPSPAGSPSPVAEPGPGRRRRQAIAAALGINPAADPAHRLRTSQCGQACLPGLFRTPLARGPGPGLPPGGAPSGNAWRRSRPRDRAARAG
jgi:hypothetical protein